jgi:hypothetical protein
MLERSVGGYCGINQQFKNLLMTLKKNLILKFKIISIDLIIIIQFIKELLIILLILLNCQKSIWLICRLII